MVRVFPIERVALKKKKIIQNFFFTPSSTFFMVLDIFFILIFTFLKINWEKSEPQLTKIFMPKF